MSKTSDALKDLMSSVAPKEPNTQKTAEGVTPEPAKEEIAEAKAPPEPILTKTAAAIKDTQKADKKDPLSALKPKTAAKDKKTQPDEASENEMQVAPAEDKRTEEESVDQKEVRYQEEHQNPNKSTNAPLEKNWNGQSPKHMKNFTANLNAKRRLSWLFYRSFFSLH